MLTHSAFVLQFFNAGAFSKVIDTYCNILLCDIHSMAAIEISLFFAGTVFVEKG